MNFIIIATLGKVFHDLAKDFEKKQWLFAILGVVFYYVLFFLLNIFLGFISVTNEGFPIRSITLIGYAAMILSLIFSLIFYMMLKKRWEHERLIRNREIIDEIQ